MNIYFWIFCIASVIVLMSCMTTGFQKGLVREFNAWISLLAAVVSVLLLSRIVDSIRIESLSKGAEGIILLGILAGAYKLYKLFFTSLDLIAGLPFIRAIDKALGLVMGLIQGFTLLYLIEYLMRNYLLI